jgi:hypothetical protein
VQGALENRDPEWLDNTANLLINGRYGADASSASAGMGQTPPILQYSERASLNGHTDRANLNGHNERTNLTGHTDRANLTGHTDRANLF